MRIYFDYSEWQRKLWGREGVAEISKAAMTYRSAMRRGREADQVEGNAELKRSLSRGLKDAKARRGRFV